MMLEFLRLGKPVRIFVVTIGDAYCDACSFWKNVGIEPVMQKWAQCSEAELAEFATIRKGETTSGQQVQLAAPGQKLEPGIWLAGGGRHLTLGGPTRLDLPPGGPAEIHCPSGNPLFASLAKHLGAQAAGVILTGMGDDGTTGLLALKQAGGTTVVQDEASCLIFGMPKAAQEKGAAGHVLNIAGIVKALEQMARS